MSDPIQPEHRTLMNTLAHLIDEALNGPFQPGVPRRIGFALLISEFNRIEDGRVNYISNGDRSSMLAMLREYLSRAEKDRPGATQNP
ncbi:hypothetical protein [Haematobacter genomosp. 1]|uniref:Uncharacterized protein n=1 Tax=Haematobacter genomosp. 1 TaxID=366618 RepID=A0A212AG57_9RHOB|nr:hypothetical protein [Haematobacter genomosp. 1]OWJ80419.1 hypothetical protein CDV49_01085 [Haematobacter genomosp. 1]